MKIHSRQNFTLNGTVSENQTRIFFKQPITIKANSHLEVYWVNVQFEPSADYLTEGVDVLCDLPIKTFVNYVNSTPANIAGVELPVIISIPPQTQADLSADDPAGLPAVASVTREPFTPIIHQLDNNEQQINSITFSFHARFNDRRPNDDIDDFQISFAIVENPMD